MDTAVLKSVRNRHEHEEGDMSASSTNKEQALRWIARQLAWERALEDLRTGRTGEREPVIEAQAA